MVQDNDDIIELTDEVSEDLSEEDDKGIIELTEMVPWDADPQEASGVKSPLTFEDTPPGIQTDADVADAGLQAELPRISPEMVEAALERVIEKKFSKTIEKILFEVMEKVIQKEIADIKTSLQKDLDDIGRP